MTSNRPKAGLVIVAAVASVTLCGQRSHADTYTWAPQGSTPYYWDASTSNWTSGSPHVANDIANLNTDITADQTINLSSGSAQNITVGTLNLGDLNGSNVFTIASGGAGNNTLTLSGSGGAALNVAGTSTHHTPPTFDNVISAAISLGSDLTIKFGGTTTGQYQSLSLSGGITAGSNNITISGGVPGTTVTQLALSGGLSGTGTFTNNGCTTIAIAGGGVNAFSGKVVLNNGTAPGAANSSLTLTGTASLKNTSEMVVNGFLAYDASSNLIRNKGTLVVGDSGTATADPGTRLSSTKVTLNGGSLVLKGQSNTGIARVTDTVGTVNFGSGMSNVSISKSNGSSGTTLHATDIQRGDGATLFLNYGANDGTVKFTIDHYSSLLKGGGSGSGLETKIIPWIAGRDNRADSGEPIAALSDGGFFTYDTATLSLRPIIETTEFTYTMPTSSAGQYQNVWLRGTFSPTGAVAASQTIGSLKANMAVTINSGQTLTIGTGAVMLAGSGAPINGPGTLAFGDNEGVIFGDPNSQIAAVISGSAGVTKFGGGTTTFSGTNTYTGRTVVSGGTLAISTDRNLGQTLLSATPGNIVLAGGTALSATASFTLDANRGMTIGPNSALDVAASKTLTYNGIIAGHSIPDMLPGDLTKTGTGTLTLGGANSYTGGTTIAAGTLKAGAANTLPTSGTVTFGTATTNGTLDLGGYGLQVGGLSVASGATAVSQIIGSSATTGTTSTLTVDTTGGNSSFAGVIQDSVSGGTKTLSLTKQGANTLSLSGTNTYTGDTHVTGGKLLVNGSLAVGSAVTVDSVAMLGGTNGTVAGAVTVNGTISPGNGAIGDISTLTTGAQTWNSTGAYAVDINNATGTAGGATGWDSLVMSGLTQSDGFTVKVLSSGAPANFNGTDMFQWVIARVTTGQFDTTKVTLDTSGFWNGAAGLFSLDRTTVGSGEDLVLSYSYSAVPEATTLLLGMVGLAPLLLQRRRRAVTTGTTGDVAAG